MTSEDYRSPYLTDWAQGILVALQSKLVYLGTVPPAVVAKRRTKNKIARKQRNVNRQNGSGK